MQPRLQIPHPTHPQERGPGAFTSVVRGHAGAGSRDATKKPSDTNLANEGMKTLLSNQIERNGNVLATNKRQLPSTAQTAWTCCMVAFWICWCGAAHLCLAQVPHNGDTLTYTDVVFQGGKDLKTRSGRVFGKSYLFLDHAGKAVELEQLGAAQYANIGIFGFSSACICMGDTVSLQLWTIIDPPNGEVKEIRKESMYRWFNLWGKLEVDGEFRYRSQYRKRFLKRCTWMNFTAIHQHQACFVDVLMHPKFYTPHGDFGDKCLSCHEH